MAATPVVPVAHESGVASWGTFAGDVPRTCRTPSLWKAARPHESPQMRLAQLPTARQTRHTILQAPLPRIRAAARQRRSKRIQRRTPQGETEMGAGHGHRHHTDLREMQSASPAIAGMGPRPHRRPQGLDRPRTPKLQPKRRTTQSERLSRALALMPHPLSDAEASDESKHMQRFPFRSLFDDTASPQT